MDILTWKQYIEENQKTEIKKQQMIYKHTKGRKDKVETRLK